MVSKKKENSDSVSYSTYVCFRPRTTKHIGKEKKNGTLNRKKKLIENNKKHSMQINYKIALKMGYNTATVLEKKNIA